MNHDEMVEVAASWWYQTLSGRQKYDNGDTSESGGMATMLATLAAPSPPDAGKLGRFRAAMVDWLKGQPREYSTTLDVDYGPGWELQQIMESAEEHEFAFPWKTTMWLDWEAGTVKVRHGYGAELVQLTPEVPTKTTTESQNDDS